MYLHACMSYRLQDLGVNIQNWMSAKYSDVDVRLREEGMKGRSGRGQGRLWWESIGKVGREEGRKSGRKVGEAERKGSRLWRESRGKVGERRG